MILSWTDKLKVKCFCHVFQKRNFCRKNLQIRHFVAKICKYVFICRTESLWWQGWIVMNTSPLFKYIINCLYYNNLIIAGEKRRGCAIKQKGDSLIPLSYLDALEATMCMIVWDSLIETYTDQLHRINNIIGPTIPSILKCFASIFFGTLSTNMLSNWNRILK